MRFSRKSHRPGALFVACAVGLGLVTALARAHADGPEGEPDADEIRQAQQFAATLRDPDGIPEAFRALCRDRRPTDLRRDVASTVLVERAVDAMPALLDAIDAGDTPDATAYEANRGCAEEASRIVFAAVCAGRAGDRFHVERRTAAQIAVARAAAQRALADFVAKPGFRRRPALGVLKATRDTERVCQARDEVLRRTTPALVDLLSSKEDGREALRLLATTGAVPAPAAKPRIRPYLADRATLHWAVSVLARMGENMSSHVAPLVELLDGSDADLGLFALQAIGPRAHAALPRLVLLARETAKTCSGGRFYTPRLVETLASVATRAQDVGVATEVLAPFLRCPSRVEAAKALARYGSRGRAVLVAHLLDDEKPVRDRFDVATALQSGRVKLGRAEQEMIRLVRAKHARLDRPPPVQVSTPDAESDPVVSASEELDFCRAEAGLPGVRMAGITETQAEILESCLQNYVCGPSRSTLQRTLLRCCSHVFHGQLPSFCHP